MGGWGDNTRRASGAPFLEREAKSEREGDCKLVTEQGSDGGGGFQLLSLHTGHSTGLSLWRQLGCGSEQPPAPGKHYLEPKAQTQSSLLQGWLGSGSLGLTRELVRNADSQAPRRTESECFHFSSIFSDSFAAWRVTPSSSLQLGAPAAGNVPEALRRGC